MTVNIDKAKAGYSPDPLSKKVVSAMRPLTVGEGPLNAVVMGDSTGNETTEWVYLTAVAAASKYPTHTHVYRLWNDTTQQYDQPTVLATGSAGAARVNTGSAATGWIMEVADSVATSVTGDIDVRVKMNFNGAVFSAQGAIASKYGAAGNRSWRLECLADGKLFFEWSNDGTTLLNSTSSVALSGTQLSDDVWVRATLDVNNGAVGNDTKFYTSTDGSNWTQLGTTVTKAATTSIFDSTISTQFIGRGQVAMAQQARDISFYEMEVYGSLDGSARVVDIDVGAMIVTSTTAGVTTFIDDVGNTVTVSKSASSGSFVGSNRMSWFNASTSGQAIAYSSNATRYAKQAVATLSIAIVNYSHNEANDVEYRTDYKTLTDKLLTTNPDMCICATAQNKRVSPATSISEHALRCRQVAEFAASQGFELIDVYALLGAAEIGADGIHPIAAGEARWAQLVSRSLGISN